MSVPFLSRREVDMRVWRLAYLLLFFIAESKLAGDEELVPWK